MLTSQFAKHWGHWGKVCPAEASYWSNDLTVLGINLPASVQPALIATSTHPPSWQIVCLLFRRQKSCTDRRCVSGTHRAHERWTILPSLSSLNFHSARALDMQGICCPWGSEHHQQCCQVPSSLTPLLGEAFKRQQKCYHKSSESCHPKHLAGHILFHRNLCISLRTVGSLWTVLKSSTWCFHRVLQNTSSFTSFPLL